MSWGQLLALVVLFGIILSFVVPLPDWAIRVMIGLLAVALLMGGTIMYKFRPVAS